MIKRLIIAVIAVLAVFVLFLPVTAKAEVNVNVTVPLPGLVIPAPPAMIVIPGTYVYYPPEVGVDIFFYRGYWYRPHGGAWYISGGYNGPWRGVAIGRVPRPLLRVPPHFRNMPPRHDRVPYGTVRKNWRSWERERHWDRHEDRGEYRGNEDRRERGNRGHGR